MHTSYDQADMWLLGLYVDVFSPYDKAANQRQPGTLFDQAASQGFFSLVDATTVHTIGMIRC